LWMQSRTGCRHPVSPLYATAISKMTIVRLLQSLPVDLAGAMPMAMQPAVAHDSHDLRVTAERRARAVLSYHSTARARRMFQRIYWRAYRIEPSGSPPEAIVVAVDVIWARISMLLRACAPGSERQQGQYGHVVVSRIAEAKREPLRWRGFRRYERARPFDNRLLQKSARATVAAFHHEVMTEADARNQNRARFLCKPVDQVSMWRAARSQDGRDWSGISAIPSCGIRTKYRQEGGHTRRRRIIRQHSIDCRYSWRCRRRLNAFEGAAEN